jgi:hypothetical protein
LTPFQAPNCNARAERFVRSIEQKYLNRVIPVGSGTDTAKLSCIADA